MADLQLTNTTGADIFIPELDVNVVALSSANVEITPSKLHDLPFLMEEINAGNITAALTWRASELGGMIDLPIFQGSITAAQGEQLEIGTDGTITIKIPVFTTGELGGLSAPVQGEIVYNSTESQVQVYDGGWSAVGSALADDVPTEFGDNQEISGRFASASQLMEWLAADGAQNNQGRGFEWQAGAGGAAGGTAQAGEGGPLSLLSGDGGASATGASNTAHSAGVITLQSGAGGAATDSEHDGGDGGQIDVLGGSGGAGHTGQIGGLGASVNIQAGDGGAANGGTEGDGGSVDIDAGAGATAGNVNLGTVNANDIQVGHVGANIAFYDGAPQAQQAGPGTLTDSSTGTPDAEISEVVGTSDDATINDNFAECADHINQIIGVLENLGLMT